MGKFWKYKISFLALFLVGICPWAQLRSQQESSPPASAPTLLLLRVAEGEGEIQTVNARLSKPITVLVTSETGRPQPNVAVSFRLPEEGPSGRFASGMRTEVVITGADGKATARGIVWGALAGPVTIRVTAQRGEARAGTLVGLQLTPPATEQLAAQSAGEPGTAAVRRQPTTVQQVKKQGHWLLLTTLIGGAAAGGVVAVSQRGRTTPGATPGPAAITQPAAAPVTIGPPSISIGAP